MAIQRIYPNPRTHRCYRQSASDDLQNPEKIRMLLQDIREARQAKSREGISKLDHSDLSVSSIHHFLPLFEALKRASEVAEFVFDGD